MTSRQEVVGIVCHDAGGAEIISSYILQNNLTVNYYLEGPAIKIFERKLKGVECKSLSDVVNDSDWLLCGTSWQSDIEWRALQEAKSSRKRSISFLDHWVNYLERFTFNGRTIFPDEIWVGDTYAKSIANKIFPDTIIKLVNNPYLSDVCEEFQKIPPIDRVRVPGIRVLFVSDNLGEASAFQFGYEKHFGYTDDDVLNYFIKNKNVIKDSIQKIIIRPHPSESPNKYNWAAGRYEELVEIGGGLSLLEEIANSDIVIGGDSMAMVVALYCGKRVINCIPPNGNQSILQFDKIEKIQQLIVNNKTLHQDN